MGPLASLQFVENIYKYNLPYTSDQDAPRIIVTSDSYIKDRTRCIIENKTTDFLDDFIPIIKKLNAFNVDIIIVACITFHYYYKYLPKNIRDKTINLVDLILNNVRSYKKNTILLATLGTYKSQLIKEKNIIIPEEKEQIIIHNYIYKLKNEGEINYFLMKLLLSLKSSLTSTT